MTTRHLFFLLLFLFSFSAFAQDTLEVKVVDDKQAALPFINVAVRSKADSTIVIGGMTNEEGVFRITSDRIAPLHDHQITLSGIGYLSQTITDLSPLRFVVKLEESHQLLNEVVVRGKKPIATITHDGLSISLKNSSLAHIGTGMELLTQLPLLSGNSDGVTVLGKGTPLIYINGRKGSVQDVKQLKSSDIKQVKVVTHPGAMYDASVTSVLLITTYQPLEGWGGMLYGKARVGRRLSTDLFASLQYRSGDFDVFGSVYQVQTDRPTTTSYTIAFPQEMEKQVAGSTTLRAKRTTQHYTLGLNYQPSERHSLGIKHLFSHQPQGDIHAQTTTTAHTALGFIEEQYDKDKSETSHTHHLNLYWQGRFTDNYSLKVDADFYDTKSGSHEQVAQWGKTERILNGYAMRSRLYAARLVNVVRLWGGTLNLGAEAASTENKQAFSSSIGLIGKGEDHLKNIASAAFLTYARTMGCFSSQIGLRYELNKFDYYNNGTRQEEQSKTFHHLFPHLSVIYQGWLTAQLSYRATISRPSYHQLRSGVQYNNAEMFESGNPYLAPMLHHTLSLDVQKDDCLFGAEYAVVRNLIYSDVSLYKSHPIVLFQHKNVARANLLRLYASYQTKVAWWQPSLYVGYEKPFLTIGDHTFNKGRLFLSQKNSFTLPHGIYLWANYAFSSYGHDDTALLQPSHSVSLRVMKKWCNDRLSVSLDASDIFRTEREEYLLRMNHLDLLNHSSLDSRSISLTVTYNFNTKKSRYQGASSTKEIERLK